MSPGLNDSLKQLVICSTATGTLGALIGGGYGLYHAKPVFQYVSLNGLNGFITGSCFFTIRHILVSQLEPCRNRPYTSSTLSGALTGALLMTLIRPGDIQRLIQSSIAFGLMGGVGHIGLTSLYFIVKRLIVTSKEMNLNMLFTLTEPKNYTFNNATDLYRLLEERQTSKPWYVKYSPLHGSDELALRKALDLHITLLRHHLNQNPSKYG